MNTKNILVIGGTGFIGSRVVRKLLSEGQKVICFDFKPDPSRLRNVDVKTLPGDMTHIEEIIGAVNSYKIDCIVALAYLMVGECEEYPQLAIRTNVMGINNVFEAARLTGVKRIVFPSSHAVYGPQSQYGDKLLREDDVGRPNGVYGALKQLNEFMARKYNAAYGMDIRVLRPSNVMGHGRKALIAWGGTIVSGPAIGQPVSFNYSAASKVSAIYVDDVVDLIARLCLADRVKHPVYNASGLMTTLGEIAGVVKSYVPEAQISFKEGGKRYQESVAYSIDNSRAVAEFDWRPRSIKQTVLLHINEARAEAGLPPIADKAQTHQSALHLAP